MTNRTNLRILNLCLLAFVLLGTSLPKQTVSGQGQRKFTPGEMVETGGGISAKILRCRGAGENEECEVQYYRGDDLESTPRWENALFLRTAEERVLNQKKRQAGEHETADGDVAKPQPPPPAAADERANAEQNTADCSFTPPPGDTSKTARASEQLFKRKIYDAYHIIVDGTNSAPLKLGVTFLNFQVGRPFTNIVRVDPGVGAYRANDAAPVNAIIYPVKSEHIVCEQYRDRTNRKRVVNKYACFKNRDGEWVCGADGMPKITQLN
jgi:hypothetical protein